MTAEILSRHPLPALYSLSGLEAADGRLYAIGDDSAWLYRLDAQGAVTGRIPLYEPDSGASERIAKPRKADLEALACLPLGTEAGLLAVGSGSKAARETGYWVALAPPHPVRVFALSRLYAAFRARPEMVGGGRLNLEGLAVSPEAVYFLQRGNISGLNAVAACTLSDLQAFLLDPEAGPVPGFRVRTYALPPLGGVATGFSGAALHGDFLLFTASAEDTANEIDDGPPLGSLVGCLDTSRPDQPPACTPLHWQGRAFAGKVESITVTEGLGPRRCLAAAVTDSDGAASELLTLRLHW